LQIRCGNLVPMVEERFIHIRSNDLVHLSTSYFLGVVRLVRPRLLPPAGHFLHHEFRSERGLFEVGEDMPGGRQETGTGSR
ncbi:hypothetical protein, partial [Enorma sp.]|uniref:hypothetical protein n=1 Tax=Enorma sp. TaxID=1920692 RepID=UPI003AB734EF